MNKTYPIICTTGTLPTDGSKDGFIEMILCLKRLNINLNKDIRILLYRKYIGLFETIKCVNLNYHFANGDPGNILLNDNLQPSCDFIRVTSHTKYSSVKFTGRICFNTNNPVTIELQKDVSYLFNAMALKSCRILLDSPLDVKVEFIRFLDKDNHIKLAIMRRILDVNELFHQPRVNIMFYKEEIYNYTTPFISIAQNSHPRKTHFAFFQDDKISQYEIDVALLLKCNYIVILL